MSQTMEEAKVGPTLASLVVLCCLCEIIPIAVGVGHALVSASLHPNACHPTDPNRRHRHTAQEGSGGEFSSFSVGSTYTLEDEAAAAGGGLTAEPTKGVSVGMAYTVCTDRGAVIDVRDAGAPAAEDDTAAVLRKMGSSYTPSLEKAFSSRTGEAVRGGYMSVCLSVLGWAGMGDSGLGGRVPIDQHLFSTHMPTPMPIHSCGWRAASRTRGRTSA